MYKLYFAPGAASLVVHWLLIELDLPHELVKLDFASKEHKTPEYLALNPNGVVPTMLIDGKPMFEAAAMVMLLADAKPEAGLAPSAVEVQTSLRRDVFRHSCRVSRIPVMYSTENGTLGEGTARSSRFSWLRDLLLEPVMRSLSLV